MNHYELTSKIVLCLLLIIASVGLQGQTKYEHGMQKAFEHWSEGKIESAAQLFSRIGEMEKDKWIPHYYAAQVYIVNTFGLKDEVKLDLYLEEAKKQLDRASAITKKNAEVLVMYALLNTARLTSDPDTYGPQLSPKIMGLYGQALAYEPDNPRVVFSMAEFELGTSRFFGQDPGPICDRIKASIALFDQFQSDTPFYPSWGADRAKIAAEQCHSEK